jgi:hypothetical protein
VNVGHVGNHNRCIEEARGEFLAIFHDHDFYAPEILARAVALFDAHPRAGIVCAGFRMVDPARPERVKSTCVERWGAVTDGRAIRRVLLRRWPSPVPAQTAVVRRACYEKAGGFRPECGLPCDRDLWIRILREWDLGYIAEPMARLRDADPVPSFDARRAEGVWQHVRDHLKIDFDHLPTEFEGRPVRLWWAWKRNRVYAWRQCWKLAGWALAKPHPEVCRAGPRAFRDAGFGYSAQVFSALAQSTIAGAALGSLLRLYRTTTRQG